MYYDHINFTLLTSENHSRLFVLHKRMGCDLNGCAGRMSTPIVDDFFSPGVNLEGGPAKSDGKNIHPSMVEGGWVVPTAVL